MKQNWKTRDVTDLGVGSKTRYSHSWYEIPNAFLLDLLRSNDFMCLNGMIVTWRLKTWRKKELCLYLNKSSVKRINILSIAISEVTNNTSNSLKYIHFVNLTTDRIIHCINIYVLLILLYIIYIYNIIYRESRTEPDEESDMRSSVQSLEVGHPVCTGWWTKHLFQMTLCRK